MTTSTLPNEILVDSQEEALLLLGRNGELRKRIQAGTGARIIDRGAKISILGDEETARTVKRILEELLSAVRKGHAPSMADVDYALQEAGRERIGDLGQVWGGPSPALRQDIPIKPRTRGQKQYLDAVRENTITLSIGPAGTGKTYLAMAAAVSALLNKQVNRLILTRPAVEAGENLGFLPGDLTQKVNPYLRPLYDALYSMLDFERVRGMIEREMIEVAPLAFMRGRTLGQAFVILDEAQNTSVAQMKMFLTRLGEGSKAIITGDITQIDLPPHARSGLVEARRILKGVEDIGIVHLDRTDVVRHPLVQSIIDAFERETPKDRPGKKGEHRR